MHAAVANDSRAQILRANNARSERKTLSQKDCSQRVGDGSCGEIITEKGMFVGSLFVVSSECLETGRNGKVTPTCVTRSLPQFKSYPQMSIFSKTADYPSENSYGLAKLPEGQLHTEKFPVLTYGPVMNVEQADWGFSISGLVDDELSWDFEKFLSMPQTTLRADFHCVTHWSRFDDDWTGVMFRDFFETIRHVVQPEATHVLQHAYGGYTTNLPLEWMLNEDVMFAHTFNGQPLAREHGGPMRIFTPKRYAWKGAKWIQRMEFMSKDKPGFWEENGYSNTADPWKNDRYW